MAGISIKQIQDNLSANFNIIRAMTNLTVSNGEAIIFYYNKIPIKKNTMKAEVFLRHFRKLKSVRVKINSINLQHYTVVVQHIMYISMI